MRSRYKLMAPAFGIGALLSVSLLLPGQPTSRGTADPVPLSRLESAYGLTSVWRTNTVTLTRVGTVLSMQTDSRRLCFNNTLVWLNESFSRRNRTWSLAAPDHDYILDPLLRIEESLASSEVLTVVLDPGHGGTDSGAIGRRRTIEKKAVLDISKRIRNKLRSSGLQVKLTREQDSELSLLDRTNMAKKWEADIFVSIHLNSSQNRSASGIETFLLPPGDQPSTSGKEKPDTPLAGNIHDKANTILGYYVHKGLVSQTGSLDRGIKRAQFSVLKHAPCPAALVECAFLSNPEEEAQVITAAYRDTIAEGITRGILTFASRSRANSTTGDKSKD